MSGERVVPDVLAAVDLKKDKVEGKRKNSEKEEGKKKSDIKKR